MYIISSVLCSMIDYTREVSMKYNKPVVEIINIENEDIVTVSDNCSIGVTGQNCVSINGYCSANGGKSRTCTTGSALVGGTNLIVGSCSLLTTSGTWRCTNVLGVAPGCAFGGSMSCRNLSGGLCDSTIGAT